jgi:hypothetical protein
MTKTKFLLLVLVAVIVITIGAIWIFNLVVGSKPYTWMWPSTRDRVSIETACYQHVKEADKKAVEAIAKRAADFSSFIQSRKAGAKPFAKDIVSYYGKWRVVKPHLPFTAKDGHKEYVVDKFNHHIFTTAELASTVKLAIEGGVKDLESIENELAVALRQEVLGRSLVPDEIPIAAEDFKKAIEQVVSASQWDAAKTAGNLVVSEVVSQVATQVLLRLGVSAGILTVGTVNSWWSLGAAFVIGLVVDVVWEWIDDPAGDIEKEVVAALDNLSTQSSTAIREEMTKVASQRGELWKKTVDNLLP